MFEALAQFTFVVTTKTEPKAETAPKIGLVAHFNLGLLAHINFGLSARFNFGLIA